MDSNILCTLLSRRLGTASFRLQGLDVVWLEASQDTPENRAIAEDVLSSYESLSADYAREKDLASLREERGKRLRDSDWTQLPDVPLSEAQVQAWEAYRQALRDLPATTADPANPTWPSIPV